jgi:hypothetical protein
MNILPPVEITAFPSTPRRNISASRIHGDCGWPNSRIAQATESSLAALAAPVLRLSGKSLPVRIYLSLISYNAGWRGTAIFFVIASSCVRELAPTDDLPDDSSIEAPAVLFFDSCR